jgi:dihydrofolate synthase/folylpolyglutamate synthase
VLPRFRGERVLAPEELAKIVASITPEMPCQIASSCADALRIAERSSNRVLITGSLHLAGEVLALLRGTPAAFEECAQ